MGKKKIQNEALQQQKVESRQQPKNDNVKIHAMPFTKRKATVKNLPIIVQGRVRVECGRGVQYIMETMATGDDKGAALAATAKEQAKQSRQSFDPTNHQLTFPPPSWMT